MIRVNVFYPAGQGARFDFDYYIKSHLPMVKDRLASFGLTSVSAEKGIGGLVPGSPAKYTTVATLEFTSVDALQQGLAAHGAGIMGDIPNYTDIQPIIQVSEVLM